MDKEALTKILSNLFNNAVKYAQSNIIAQLDIQPESNPNMFMITVSNDGTLIPKDMEEDIFKPFVQIKNTDNGQRTAGTGIGLPLARSLAELHKGKLYLKNEDQICFCVELPITQENVIQLSKHYIEDSPNIPDRHLATTPENQNTILVIDDDPEILSFVSKQLQNTYKIITATNGKEALDILETESVNLIVSDVMMPEIDGFELCKRLKNNIIDQLSQQHRYSHIDQQRQHLIVKIQPQIQHDSHSQSEKYPDHRPDIRYHIQNSGHQTDDNRITKAQTDNRQSDRIQSHNPQNFEQ